MLLGTGFLRTVMLLDFDTRGDFELEYMVVITWSAMRATTMHQGIPLSCAPRLYPPSTESFFEPAMMSFDSIYHVKLSALPFKSPYYTDDEHVITRHNNESISKMC